MKMMVIFSLIFLILFQVQVCAKKQSEKATEDAMKKTAEEMSWGGQVETGKELTKQLMGELTKEPSGSSKKTDDGWDMTSMMLSMFWGSVGTGYFIYGKKQARAVFLLCGIGLCVFPMVVSNMTTSVILGVVMCVAPFKIDL